MPNSQNLYVLKEVVDKSEPGGRKLLVVSRNSHNNGQLKTNKYLNNFSESEQKRNNPNKIPDILSLKAHLHHKVRDIGKRILQGSFSNENHNQLPHRICISLMNRISIS